MPSVMASLQGPFRARIRWPPAAAVVRRHEAAPSLDDAPLVPAKACLPNASPGSSSCVPRRALLQQERSTGGFPTRSRDGRSTVSAALSPMCQLLMPFLLWSFGQQSPSCCRRRRRRRRRRYVLGVAAGGLAAAGDRKGPKACTTRPGLAWNNLRMPSSILEDSRDWESICKGVGTQIAPMAVPAARKDGCTA